MTTKYQKPFYTLLTLTRALTFKVTRQNPELIPPAKPTPHEFKHLSNIDNQDGNRNQTPIIQFYRKNSSVEANPVEVIRKALAKALVPYYPFAGRLREEAATRKLAVECTGEGVMFIEAEADVKLQQFGVDLLPPFPCLEELLYDVPGSGGIINCPLLLIQVTRLKCGGFIFSLRFNHAMTDATGIFQFMSAVGELAGGAEAPSVQPVWERHRLNGSNVPDDLSCSHDDISDTKTTLDIPPSEDMVSRHFFFGTDEISAIRNRLPPHLRHCTTKFELLTACLWRCRTIALSPDPNEEVKIVCVVNCRRRLNPPLPNGFYGNSCVWSAATATAESLSKSPFHFTVELVKNAKAMATEEYIKSVPSPMVTRRRLKLITVAGTFVVTDLKHLSFGDVDFGWGKAVYGGLAKCDPSVIPGILGVYNSFKNNKGESGIDVTISLPANAMEVFTKELKIMVKKE